LTATLQPVAWNLQPDLTRRHEGTKLHEEETGRGKKRLRWAILDPCSLFIVHCSLFLVALEVGTRVREEGSENGKEGNDDSRFLTIRSLACSLL